MKSIWTKIPATVGVMWSVRAWLGFALFLSFFENGAVDQGEGLAWLAVELIVAVCSACMLTLDAVLSLIKCFMGIDRVFNLGLALGVLSLMALLYVVLIKYLYLILCLLISFAIIALEVVSFVRHVKINRQTAEKRV